MNLLRKLASMSTKASLLTIKLKRCIFKEHLSQQPVQLWVLEEYSIQKSFILLWNIHIRTRFEAEQVTKTISGEITEGNKAIVDDPSSINADPEGASWFFKLKIKEKGEFESLMSKEEYEKFCKDNPN